MTGKREADEVNGSQLSAFAISRQRRTTENHSPAPAVPEPSSGDTSVKFPKTGQRRNATLRNDHVSRIQTPESSGRLLRPRPSASPPLNDLDPARLLEHSVEDPEADSDSSSNAPSHSLPIPSSRQFTTIGPDNVTYDEADGLHLSLRPGEILVLVGQYDITVRSGMVSLAGALLTPLCKAQRIYAPITHSLPPIRCVPNENGDYGPAELEIATCKSGIRLLQSLSPLYGRIWNEKSTSGTARRSFSVLYNNSDDERYRNACLLEVPKQWQGPIQRILDLREVKRPVVIICGPKSCGKSTFACLLINGILTRRLRNANKRTIGPNPSISFLDLDPGQPEFSPSGQISLLHLQSPEFGPPFTHPTLPEKGSNRLLRAHALASLSPKSDPQHFEACVADLFGLHQRALKSCPLVVNYSSWLTAQGMEVLLRLIKLINPTHLIYTSEDGPGKIVDALKEDGLGMSLHIVPAQPTQNRSRSSAQKRAMQMLSYFHLAPSENEYLQWNSSPLTHSRPWVMGYGGEDPEVFKMMVVGARVASEQRARVIDGSIVALVLVDRKLDLPYLDEPPDPSKSQCVGYALVRGIDVKEKTLHLLTPVNQDKVQTLMQDNRLVLIGGKMDAPAWAYVEGMAIERHRSKPGTSRQQPHQTQELPWIEMLYPDDATKS